MKLESVHPNTSSDSHRHEPSSRLASELKFGKKSIVQPSIIQDSSLTVASRIKLLAVGFVHPERIHKPS